MSGLARELERLPGRRRALILEQVRASGGASIQMLTERLGVSASTIRRDLEHLTEGGYLERTHGGALLQGATRATFEPEGAIAAALATGQKQAIGREAVRRLRAGASVLLDASSTVLEVARSLAAAPLPLTVVTNGLAIAACLAEAPQIKVLVLGGTLRPHSQAILGEPATSFLQNIHADLCFLGVHAITGTMLTETTLEGAALKRAMMRAARDTILLADSTKLDSPAFCSICDATSLAELITDDGIAPADLAQLRAAGVRVSVVACDEPGLRSPGGGPAA